MFWNKRKKEYLVIATNLQGNPVVFTTEEMPIYKDAIFWLKRRVFGGTHVAYCSVEELLEKFEQIIFLWNDSITRTFYKEDIQENVTEDLNKNNLLEIKLKDTDSVPEVFYKGQRVDEMPRGLIDITYHWHTEDDEYQAPRGVNDITIEYYDSPNNKYLDRKIIGHKRDM
ncbi:MULTISPECIES: hypothetical protein [Enterococcus]|uniref:hypothetical protein n=1 Tax=Enterococcus TaxID=1350 RepID=UPI00069A3247|nr:hypothetical protein [Enterococcus faecium]